MKPSTTKRQGVVIELHGADRAPFHSMTSSARASSVGGKVRPSAFAVFIFIISSYLVGPPPRRPRARCNSNRNDWAQLD